MQTEAKEHPKPKEYILIFIPYNNRERPSVTPGTYTYTSGLIASENDVEGGFYILRHVEDW